MAIPFDKDLRTHGKKTRHGDTRNSHKARLYRIWRGMRNRVLSPTNREYPRYGGRGISLAPEWNDYSTFREWALKHGYHNNLSIDRIDNDGDYCPSNCRWADRVTQQRNKASTRFLTYRGKTAPMAEHADDAGLKYLVVQQRIDLLGWSTEDALEKPLGQKRRSKEQMT
jgi:hypothetical protein